MITAVCSALISAAKKKRKNIIIIPQIRVVPSSEPVMICRLFERKLKSQATHCVWEDK